MTFGIQHIRGFLISYALYKSTVLLILLTYSTVALPISDILFSPGGSQCREVGPSIAFRTPILGEGEVVGGQQWCSPSWLHSWFKNRELIVSTISMQASKQAW